MSRPLEIRAEILKTARLLQVDEAELYFLADVPLPELRDLRAALTDRLFTAAPGLSLAATGAALLPAGLIATIAQRAFGPLLCARAAGGVETRKAVAVARRLSPKFLADVAIHLDPRRVADIIAEVPGDLVVPVARELGRRGEHVTMGRFLGYVADEAVGRAISALSDEAMLRTAFVLEHKDRLDHAVGMLPPERISGILRTASEEGLWPEALDLLQHLSDERTAPIADVVAGLDEAVVARLVEAVSEAGIWTTLLPIVRVMSPESREAVVRLSPFHSEEVLTEILQAATADGLWVDLVPLIRALPPMIHARVAGLVPTLSEEQVFDIVREAAETPDTLGTLLALVRETPEEGRAAVHTALARLDRRVGEQLIAGLAMTPGLLPLLTEDLMMSFLQAAHRLELTEELAAALDTASR